MITNKVIRVSLKPYKERRITFFMEQLYKLVELYNTLTVHPKNRFTDPEYYGFRHLMDMVSKNTDPYKFTEFKEWNEEVGWITEGYKSSDANLPCVEISYFMDLCEITIEYGNESYTYANGEINQLLDYRFDSVEG